VYVCAIKKTFYFVYYAMFDKEFNAIRNALYMYEFVCHCVHRFERPDNIVHAYPVVETLWAYKGRKDKRASPFFISFDFFVPVETSLLASSFTYIHTL